ncbi:hypothetical protein, partial [Fibrobacter sp.]|uniref:hypothetical protein n=1 Tax=Fibrobacter sp. TaxID=35828 RepID=UPI00388D807E
NKNVLDSVYRYDVDTADVNVSAKGSVSWRIPYDSLRRVNKSSFIHGKVNGGVNADFTLVETDSSGNDLTRKKWTVDSLRSNPDSLGWSIWTSGDSLLTTFDYIFSKDTLRFDYVDRSHSVPFENVLAQNGADSLLASDWVKNVKLSVDSLVERDTNKVDSVLKKHPYLEAVADAANGRFLVKWNGIAPQKRLDEIGTFRGRIPGDDAPWSILRVSNGFVYSEKSGVQEAEPDSKPYPVLARINMNKLQGNTSFFLTYGGKNSTTYYKQLDVYVGKRVNPEDSAVVQSMYANVGVEFVPYAWGNDPVDVAVRTVSSDEYVFKTFGNLGVVGPVVEVLPSHNFGDDRKNWPVVKVTLSKADVAASGFDVGELQIYKPDFDNREIVPLENQEKQCFRNDSLGMNLRDSSVSCDTAEWDYVVLKAKTHTFSDFFVLDTNAAK